MPLTTSERPFKLDRQTIRREVVLVHHQPSRAWVDRLLENATITPRALQEFSKLNPDVPWLHSSDALRSRLEAGRPYRRRGWQPRIELATGASVPLDYIEVQLRGRQVAKIRKDRLGESQIVSVRAIGSVVDADRASRRKRRHTSRRAA
jgi:hypothetical protein